MFSEPDGRRLLLTTADHLGYRLLDNADLVWGMGNRTVSGPVHHNDTGETAWLRLLAAKAPGGKLWTGNTDADQILPNAVPRPRLLAVHDPDIPDTAVRAELFAYVTAPVISPSPDLQPGTPTAQPNDAWWQQLRTAISAVSATPVPPWREPVISIAFVQRSIGAYHGITVDPAATTWHLAHGDLHWANLTGNPLAILDWEGIGAAPAGFDAANLYAYSLPQPDTAARVRALFTQELNSPEGRLAELLVAAIILQAAERDPIHARLAPAVRHHADHLLGQPAELDRRR